MMNVRFLGESARLGTLKELRAFLDKNFPVPPWSADRYMGDDDTPHEMLKHSKDYFMSFYYPDGSEGKWFFTDNVLFVSGTLNESSGKVSCFVLPYFMNQKTKSITRFPFYSFCEVMNGDDLDAKRRKEMSNFMRAVMRKVSNFRDSYEAEKYLKRASEDDFLKHWH